MILFAFIFWSLIGNFDLSGFIVSTIAQIYFSKDFCKDFDFEGLLKGLLHLDLFVSANWNFVHCLSRLFQIMVVINFLLNIYFEIYSLHFVID